MLRGSPSFISISPNIGVDVVWYDEKAGRDWFGEVYLGVFHEFDRATSCREWSSMHCDLVNEDPTFEPDYLRCGYAAHSFFVVLEARAEMRREQLAALKGFNAHI